MIDIDGHSLTLDHVEAVARGGTACLAAESRARVERSRTMVDAIVREGRPVYGISTGVGRLCTVTIPPADAQALQHNILRSHAAGVGAPLDEASVRAMMVLRANTLAGGYSGVRPIVIERLLEMLAHGVHPIVPEQGSLGASGDLAPLAHMALVLIGEGEATVSGVRLRGGDALGRAGIEPLSLLAKEGIALINGTQFMAAIGTLFLLAAERLTELADVAGALTLEALGGTDRAFHPLIQEARPHPGQRASAERIRRALEGSERAAGEDYARIQDAYSLRCMPQVHGAVRHALKHLREILSIEINSATDNPLIFPEEGQVISGGNFHGQPLALSLDYAAIAVAALASISERRTERLVNPQLSGLPAFLAEESGLNSGYMLAQYTAAALVSENKVLAHPASVDSIPSSANQEDHVSMGAHAARKATAILRNAEQVLAIELNVACQAVEFGQGRLGRDTTAVYGALRAVVPRARTDRSLAPDFSATVDLIRSGAFLAQMRMNA